MANFNTLIKNIKKDKVSRVITPRQLFNYLGLERRTSNNCYIVDEFLRDNSLKMTPHYNDVWIDHRVTLSFIQPNEASIKKDPIKRLKLLKSSTTEPVAICRDAKLNEATTLMMLNRYSQLPVLSAAGNMRSLCGYISWETIGNATTHGVDSDTVKDYMCLDWKNRTFPLETPLLEAIDYVHKLEFIFVTDEEQKMCGILTTNDISSQYLSITEPFMLLEQIENYIRMILDDTYTIEEMHDLCLSEDEKERVNSINDLTFGQYIRLIEPEDRWSRLEINCDRKTFIKQLIDVCNIRNGLMHFEPDGISKENHLLLKRMSDFLNSIVRYY